MNSGCNLILVFSVCKFCVLFCRFLHDARQGKHYFGTMRLIRAYVAKRYFNSKATVDVQITALFLNLSPTVT